MKPISKSQFKLGLECIQKLRHYRAGLPSTTADNDLLKLLAEGGGAVEALQRAVEKPFWVGPDGGADKAPESFQNITRAMAEAKKTGKPQALYEVTIVHGNFMARIDLLRLFPAHVELVEIKGTSWSPPTPERPCGEILNKNTTAIMSGWVPYVQDLAFQYELLSRWLGENASAVGLPKTAKISPRLLLVKSGGRAGAADRLASFRSRYQKDSRGNLRAEVEYRGPGINATDLLEEVHTQREVDLMLSDAQAIDPAFDGCGIAAAMKRMEAILLKNTWPPALESLSAKCRKCEYRHEDVAKSGLVKCWGKNVDPIPSHILKLAYLKDAQVRKVLTDHLPAEASFAQLHEDELQDRQKSQWHCARNGQNEIKASFRADRFGAMQTPSEGPIYFLDFETSAYPIPSRIGGEPYELVPFQFEGHRLPSRTANLSERVLLPGFLDLTSDDPRRAMVRALAEQFGSSGPIYHWATHENTVIKKVLESIEAENGGDDDRKLIASGRSIISRLVDLLVVAKKNITLPETNGSYSIKKLLPVIWADPTLRQAFSKGQARNDPNFYEDARDPYKSLGGLDSTFANAIGQGTLLALSDEDGAPTDLDFAINNGGLAMLYYHYVRLFGGAESPDIQRQFRQYCQLDSAAMVMAFDYLRRV
jgi:hypothetical protein